MKLVNIEPRVNMNAIEILEEAIKSLKAGEIAQISVSWVDKDGACSGDTSEGDRPMLMWASMHHVAQSFYNDVITGDNGDIT